MKAFTVCKKMIQMTAVSAAMVSASLVHAGTADCAFGECTWVVDVAEWNVNTGQQLNTQTVMSGTYTSNPETGAIESIMRDVNGTLVPVTGWATENGTTTSGDAYEVNISNVFGNVDPILGFAFSANNNSSNFLTYSFAFGLPLGGITAPINAESQLSGSLTTTTANGGSVFPTLGPNMLVATDINTTNFQVINKGVDTGTTVTNTGIDNTTFDFGTTNAVINNGTWDLMSVVVAFGLSPNTAVGMSGLVIQEEITVVPLPAAVWFMSSGLLGLFGMSLRRRQQK